MKRFIIYFSLLLALFSPATLWASGNYVIINQVMYDTPKNENAGQIESYDGEFFELYNGGTDDVSLNGWCIHSISGKNNRETYALPDITISAGGYMIFASNQGKSTKKHKRFMLSDVYESLKTQAHPVIVYYKGIVLANSNDTLILLSAQNDTIDKVAFGKKTNHQAKNKDSIPGDDCVSLHRSGVELDDAGKVIFSESQWNTAKVSFGVNQLPNPIFGTRTVIDLNSSADSSTTKNNYILSVTPLDAIGDMQVSNGGVSIDAGVRTNTTVQYYDGLGRPNELIAVGATPNKKDIVSTISYNGLHRATQQWLPIQLDSKGQFTDIATIQQQAQDEFDDDRPFTETLYENSALERVIGQKRPGESYEGHPSSCSYSSNTETDIHIYTVILGSLKTHGYYEPHTLYKTTTADEDGKGPVITFTDKLGRKVMEERSGSRTYFVYDDLGRLSFVIPNLSNSKLADGVFDLENATLKAIAYCYQYDDRGNVIRKRLPGCDWQYMVYDVMGQLVLKQDGNQRLKDEWTLFAYDSIGRNVYTAEIIMEQGYLSLVDQFANEWQVGDKALSVLGIEKSGLRMLTESYYDNYDYPEADGLAFVDGYDSPYSSAKGLLTGARIYDIEEQGHITTAYHYDANGRIVQSRSLRSADGYKTVTSIKYNFDGSIAQQLVTQSDVTEHYRYTYDHFGRQKETKYQLNDDPEITLSAFSYDELGRLVQNLLYNGKDTITYAYDMRNMLTETKNKYFSEMLYYADIPSGIYPYAISCYNGNISLLSTTLTGHSNTFYHRYDEHNRLTYSCLGPKHGVRYGNGEIFSYDDAGNIIYLKRNDGKGIVDDLEFYYGDEGNQLLSVNDNGTDADGYNEIEYEGLNNEGSYMHYDANGNLIKDLDRDISTIHYNMLNLPDTIQFVNGHQIVNLYDATGKKYRTIDYINLISGSAYNNNIAHYTFDMDSVNYRITEYKGNIVNIYAKVDSIMTMAQTIYNTAGYNKNGTHYHYIKNHIGSNCAVVNSIADTLVQGTVYYASGVPMRISSNRDQQPYLYNGKEFIEAHGLNEYDSQARMYYATIMRTTTMDPLAEDYYHISPYSWCNNDPVNRFDPDGMAWRPTHTYDEVGNQIPNGYEWVDPANSYDKNGNLLSGLYEQAIFFSDNGTYSQKNPYNIGSSTATVYLTDGTTQEYNACTYPSSLDKYPTIPEREYEASVGIHHGSKSSYLALKMRDIGAKMQTIELGFTNPAHTSRTYAEGVDVHKAGKYNFTGIDREGNAISEACFVIDITQWDSFMSHFEGMPQGSIIGIQASRTLSQPINANRYPAFNFIYNGFRTDFINTWRW